MEAELVARKSEVSTEMCICISCESSISTSMLRVAIRRKHVSKILPDNSKYYFVFFFFLSKRVSKQTRVEGGKKISCLSKHKRALTMFSCIKALRGRYRNFPANKNKQNLGKKINRRLFWLKLMKQFCSPCKRNTGFCNNKINIVKGNSRASFLLSSIELIAQVSLFIS